MKLDRAWGMFETKAVNDESREISGVATTISADRMSDVVVPGGAKFALPIPLLSQHDSREPIGKVYEAEVSGRSIRIKARIAKDTGLDYVERTWRQIRAGLLGGLSIGFRPLKSEALDPERPWDGFKFLEWEWLELSAVTIPANAEATIQTVKSIATAEPAAFGRRFRGVSLAPGVSGSKDAAFRGVKLISKGNAK